MVKVCEHYKVMYVLYLYTRYIYSIALRLVGISMYKSWNIKNNKEGVWE